MATIQLLETRLMALSVLIGIMEFANTRETAAFGGISLALREWEEMFGQTDVRTDRQTDKQT